MKRNLSRFIYTNFSICINKQVVSINKHSNDLRFALVFHGALLIIDCDNIHINRSVIKGRDC